MYVSVENLVIVTGEVIVHRDRGSSFERLQVDREIHLRLGLLETCGRDLESDKFNMIYANLARPTTWAEPREK